MHRSTRLFAATWATMLVLSSPATFASASCDEALTGAANAQAEALFDGALACLAQQREADGHFLLIAGQVRSTADMMMFQPRSDEAKRGAAALYGRVYYQMGGAGSLAFYADERVVASLYERVTSWSRDAGAERAYRPSWKSEPVTDMADYGGLLAEHWSVRKVQLESYARSARNPEYVRLDTELQQLMRENSTGFVGGTPAAERAQELQLEMSRIAPAASATPPPTPIAERISLVQDPANAARVLHVGFSGRADMHAEAFTSPKLARESWLAEAIDAATLDALLAKVDFSRETLVVMSTGVRSSATGEVKLDDLSVTDPGWSINASVAVQPLECDAAEDESYPFIVARAPLIEDTNSSGVGAANFPGPCVAAQRGAPARSEKGD